ncbi:4-phosphoerythronate dehydrogenase [Alteromonas halophila]|uniref:Erythronate-4-phosphate dehydrogenase n=1 Tax=Alteromonas halophila TaxID=516698 RepID=A0A918JR64_9ALTE|nr:4-phosphoerythronate dehydrogenase [Alteromonas halophila]GGW95129.1 erythronate-4-phosphate dehydrogenase [Alteromonas halophila]
MTILVEDTIPFGDEYFSTLGHVRRYAWQSLTPAELSDVDYLVVRSTTKVTPALLAKASKLKLVTTATAGTNHMDTHFLDKAGIAWNSAAGCNALAVAEYVISALLHAARDNRLRWPQCTVGIVGAGNVGTALARVLTVLGINYKLCDPPRQEAGDPREFVSLSEVLNCDAISLHVPLIKSGKHATQGMVNATVLAQLTASQALINACRGEVVDEAALVERCQADAPPTVILDVFENEPAIDLITMDLAWLATPHIAGHSIEGKVRGTQLVYEQVCQAMGLTPTLELDDFLTAVEPVHIQLSSPDASSLTLPDLTSIWHRVYDIQYDDRHFRKGMAESDQFASLRKHYRVRRECAAFTLMFPHTLSAGIRRQLNGLGFRFSTHPPM